MGSQRRTLLVARADIAISLDTCDKDGDTMLDYWEARYGLDWTDAADALQNPDGDALYNLHEYWAMTDPRTADSHTNCALADAAHAVDSRLAGLNPTNAIRIFSVQDHAATNYVRNPGCWAADIDLTCCSPWNSYVGNGWSGWHRAGTLISPRHVLFAAHFDDIPTNHVLRFVDRQNNIVERRLVASKRHPLYVPLYPDLTVGLLDTDVPTNQICFAKVLPDDYMSYIWNGNRLPVLRLDQEEKASVGDLYLVVRSAFVSGSERLSTSCLPPTDPVRSGFYEDVIPGDSGNPAFLVLRGQPVLLTVWSGPLGGSGTSVTAFKDDINQLMSDLGGDYQLTEIDLTMFTRLSE